MAAILTTAIRLFAERGYAGVSLDELAMEAGVRRTLLLYYYKSKDELWRAAAADVSAAFNRSLADKLAKAGGKNDRERLHSTLEASLDAYLEEPDFPRFLIREGGMESPRLHYLVEHFNYADVKYSSADFSRLVGTTILRDVMFAVFLSMAALGPLMEASLSRASGRRKPGVYPMSAKNRRELVSLLTAFMMSVQRTSKLKRD